MIRQKCFRLIILIVIGIITPIIIMNYSIFDIYRLFPLILLLAIITSLVLFMRIEEFRWFKHIVKVIRLRQNIMLFWIIVLLLSILVVSKDINYFITPGTIFLVITGLITLTGFLFTLYRIEEIAYQKITNFRDLFYATQDILSDKNKDVWAVVMTPATGNVSYEQEYNRIMKPFYDKNDDFHHINMICLDGDGLDEMYNSYVSQGLKKDTDIKKPKEFAKELIRKLENTDLQKKAKLHFLRNKALPDYHFYVRNEDVLIYFPLGIQPFNFQFFAKNGERKTIMEILGDKDFKVDVMGIYSQDSLLVKHFKDTYKIYEHMAQL